MSRAMHMVRDCEVGLEKGEKVDLLRIFHLKKHHFFKLALTNYSWPKYRAADLSTKIKLCRSQRERLMGALVFFFHKYSEK